jgi:hypothetical protein
LKAKKVMDIISKGENEAILHVKKDAEIDQELHHPNDGGHEHGDNGHFHAHHHHGPGKHLDHHHGDDGEVHHHIDTSVLNSNSQRRAALGGFILWLSLVSHSLFEGLALGSTNIKQLWKLFTAIISHHLISSLVLGTVLNQGIKNIFVSIFFILSFSSSIPLGMIVGISVTNIEGEVLNIVQAISFALASGAFFYVSIFEILAHFNPRNKISLVFKILLFIFGFVVISIIANYT